MLTPLPSIYKPATEEYNPYQLLPQQTSTSLSPLQSLTVSLITYAIGGTPIAYTLAASKAFQLLFYGLIHLGQLFPELPPSDILPKISRQRFPLLVQSHAASALAVYLERFAFRFVSLIFDAGDIHGKHCAAICLCNNERRGKPSFFQLSYGPWTKADYILFINQLLSILDQHRIKVISICTDGLPVQVHAIEECQEYMQAGHILGRFAPVLIPFHIPCLNHRINNILEDTFYKHPVSLPIITTIQSFTKKARTPTFKTALTRTCPGFIKTRWLYLGKITAFIRLHRLLILAHSGEDGWLTQEDLLKILKLEILLQPLIELQLFFEDHQTKLCHVYPAIIRTLFVYAFIIQSNHFSSGPWLHLAVDCMVSIFNKVLTGNIGSLVELAFVSSQPGRQFARAHHRAVGYVPSMSLFRARKESESQTVFYTEEGLRGTKQHSIPWINSFVTVCSLFNHSQSSAEPASNPTPESSDSSSATTSSSSESGSVPPLEDPSSNDHSLFEAIVEPTVALDIPTEQEEDDSDSESSDHSPQTTTTSSSSTATSSSQRATRNSFLFQLPSSLARAFPASLDFTDFPYSVPVTTNKSILKDATNTNKVLNVHSIDLKYFTTQHGGERSFMSVYELLSLYSEIESEPLQFLLQFEADSESIDDDEEDFSDGESASEDFDPLRPDFADKPIKKIALHRVRQPRHFSYPHSNTTVDDEVETSDSAESDVVLMAAGSMLAHPPYHDDETEWKIVQQLFQSIIAWPPDYLQHQFEAFLLKVLPKGLLHLRSEVLHDLMVYLTSEKQELASVESQLVFDPRSATPDRLSALILASLNFAVCSESESERILSISSHICPPRRSNWSLVRMNHSLLIHLGVPPSIPKTRSDISG